MNVPHCDATIEAKMTQLNLLGKATNGPGGSRSISPLRELGAYEELWCREKASFKALAEQFRHANALPSELVDADSALRMSKRALELLREASVTRFGVRIHGDHEYPARLRDARYPVELLYYQGWWNLLEAPSVAVVGTRKSSAEGLRRTRRLVHHLVADGWAIVSGLAEGIDTAAHTAAIEAGGMTIAVLGTPLTTAYPKTNRELQVRLAREFLVVSQVPIVRYSEQTYRTNRLFFPERNLTMSALTQATIIVEAGETSGTLIQARGALEQNRKLFILDSCFRRGLTWPEKFLQRGAIRIETYEDIHRELGVADAI